VDCVSLFQRQGSQKLNFIGPEGPIARILLKVIYIFRQVLGLIQKRSVREIPTIFMNNVGEPRDEPTLLLEEECCGGISKDYSHLRCEFDPKKPIDGWLVG